MKHYVLNPTGAGTPRYHSGYDYLIELDRQIGSLYDYLVFINPNYLVFNETDVNTTNAGVYYSNRELEKLHLIKPVYFKKAAYEYHKGIIIFPSHLPFHCGLVNNFSEYEKDYTILCWFSYDDVFNSGDGWGAFGAQFVTRNIIMPSTREVLVPANSGVIDYDTFIEKGKLMTGFGLTDVDNNTHKISSATELRLVDVNATLVDEEYSSSDVVSLVKGQLRLVSGSDVIGSEEGLNIESQAVENTGVSPIMIFPEAYTVISLVAPSYGKNDGHHVEKQKPSNFFLGTLSASAAIYQIVSSVATGSTYYSAGKYYPPTKSTGADLLFNFIPPRSYLKRNLTNGNSLTGSSSSFQQLSTNFENNRRKIYIGNGLSVNNTAASQIGTQYDPINSEFVLMTSNNNNIMIEPIEVIHEVQKTSTTNLAGEGVAMYTIDIKNYKTSLFNNIKGFIG